MTEKKSNLILLLLDYNVITIPTKMQAISLKTSSCSLGLALMQAYEQHKHIYVCASVYIFILYAFIYICI